MGKKGKSAAAVELGAKGGKARARNLSKQQLSAIGLEAARMRWKKAEKMRYVHGIPRKPLAKGVVLVHNHVRPQPVLGWNGFRAWTQILTDDLEVCPCDWAGVDLRGLVHYRVKREKGGK